MQIDQQIAAAIKSKLVIGNPESMHHVVEALESIIRGIAERCFDAGYNHATDTDYFPMGDGKKSHPDFDTFYTNLTGHE